MNNLINQIFDEFFGKDLEKFQTEYDNFFNDLCKDVYVPSFQLSKGSYPKVNVVEEDDKFKIIAGTPGMEKEDLSISYKNGMLSISGSSNQTKEEKTKYVCRELKKSSFIRSFRIDESEVDVAKISSSYKNGELVIHVPKKVEEERTESVNIKIK
jgi:HSP20 family protein